MVDIPFLLKHWEITDIVDIKQLEEGNVNQNWLITTENSKFILKRLEFADTSQLIFEIQFLENLKSNLFPYQIPQPILAKNNASYIEINGKIFWIYEYIQGVIKLSVSDSELHQIISLVTSIHTISIKFKEILPKIHSIRSFDWLVKETQDLIKKCSSKDKKTSVDQDYLVYSKISLEYLQGLSVDFSHLSTFPIHRDINHNNLLWSEEGILIGIIDFENVSNSNEPLIKDLAVLIQHFCYENSLKVEIDFEKLNLMLSQYLKSIVCSDEEIDILTELIIAGWIEDFNYAYWRYNYESDFEDTNLISLYGRKFEWLMQNQNIKDLEFHPL